MRRRGTYQRNDNESHRVKNHLGIPGHSEVYDRFVRRRGTYQRNDNESHRVKNHLGICGHSEVYDGFVRRRGTYYTNNIILIWKHITPSHCSVMEACRQRLEDVDRNHTMM